MTEQKSELEGFPTNEELVNFIIKEGIKTDRNSTFPLPDGRIVNSIDYTISQLKALPAPVKEEFIHWYKTNQLKSWELEVKGLTIGYFKWRFNTHMLYAFINFGDLYRNPEDTILLKTARVGLM